MTSPPSSIVVMGVSGSGKTTIARALATRLEREFIDADGLHSAHNLEKMAAGHALDDDDRLPWLRWLGQRLREAIETKRATVTACSALKRSYRDLLRLYDPAIYFVYLAGDLDIIKTRVDARRSSVLPSTLLASQFAILEPLEDDERGRREDVRRTPETIVRDVVAAMSGDASPSTGR